MRLSRRDALAALAVAGVGAGVHAAGGLAPPGEAPPDGASGGGGEKSAADEDGLAERHLDALVAVAGVVYPSEVEDVESFVHTYATGKARERPDHAAGVRETLERLDHYAETFHDARFVDLEPATRERLLDRMGADVAEPDPDGGDHERVRYYLVNDLLFALYASPAGGRLLGIENPPGHPGGTASYQRGPEDG